MPNKKYWLFKSEPNTFSIDDLKNRPEQTEPWNGVRNYQARNMLRDDVQLGDLGFFYHSNCTPPGIVGIFKIVKAGYPDHTACDAKSDFFDPKSTIDNPRWYMVDVKFVKKFARMITLDEIKQHAILKNMQVARQGNRLSITPVTEKEWNTITEIAKLS
ncbi:EVE domain-containing protein [Gammaproteobacteria bacterium SCGC AG-212-F23]|nr:EVE domain-containing protein [Gammaproteobacteria bacterium SCGC AG-212-F23]